MKVKVAFLRRLKKSIPAEPCLIIIFSLSACGGGPSSPPSPPQDSRPDIIFTGNHECKYERTLSPTGNDLYTIVVDVRNQGKASAESVQVIAHSKGPGLEGDRPPLDNNGYYSIGIGETVQARFEFIFEKQFFGEYTFTITVDPSNAVYELDEFNNVLEFKCNF